jgi:hypothetical protein
VKVQLMPADTPGQHEPQLTCWVYSWEQEEWNLPVAQIKKPPGLEFTWQ